MTAQRHPEDTTRTVLRCLYGAAGAHLRGDHDAVQIMTSEATTTGLGAVLHTGAMSIAEQLRDVAEWRNLSPDALIRVLLSAHTEMAHETTTAALILTGAVRYLEGHRTLWNPDELCALAACPSTAAETCTKILAAALSWRARDTGVPAGDLTARICLGLASRAAGLHT